MGRRSKEKQLVAHASRRRTVLQIDKVSRREASEGPVKTGITRTVNPNSITGIGLLGAYGDHSDDEEGGGGEEQHGPVEERNDYNSHQETGPATASTSTTGQHSEIDAKLADFFKEIESMDPDTTSSAVEDDVKRAPDEAVSSTTDDRIMSEEGYEPEEPASSSGNDGVTYPWQMCLDEGTNCYYYWNTETNEVQWYPPVQETAVPDTQTVDEGRDPGEKPVTLVPEYQEDNSDHERPQSENEEKASEAASENSSKEAHSKPNSDDDMHMDGFQVLDSWEDKENGIQVSLSKKGSPEEMREATDADKVPAKRLKIEEFEEDSDDEFAAQLLEDTYEKGKKDILVEESMELSEDEGDKMEDEESDKEGKCLLPPEVFEHLRTAPPVPEKKETTPVIDEKETKHATIKEVECRSQILSLSSVLTNKLDFLEVSRDGMSTLKILLIEMETRIADWREGALDSHHLVQKLCQADKQLKQYEESASPPGWTCHWDRSHKRYYYRHQVTGDAQWEYPTDEVNRDADNSSGTAAALQSSTAALQSSAARLQSSAPLQSSSVALQTSAAVQSSAAVHSSAVAVDTSAQSSLPMWSIPGYVTMVQAPVMPVVMTTVPVVSSSVTAESYMNPPVPGTDDGSEAVPFTVSFSEAEEESPPPPPGTDDLPPLPPVDSPAPPPPPPEPSEEIPPPPPGEEIIASPMAFATRLSAAITKGQATVCTSVTKSAPPVRSLVDYSDLDNFGTSAPPTDVTVAVPQSVGTQLTAAIQGATETTVPLPAATGTKTKTKRKKKAPKVSSTLLSSKARKVSSLVQKWQSIKQQEEPGLESSEEDEEENNPAKQIEDWKKEHVMSGQSNYNPNFEEIKGDWRERIRQRQAKVKTKAAADEKDT